MSMNDVIGDFRNRIEALKKKVAAFTPQQDKTIRDEIRQLYVDIANVLGSLTKAQEEIRRVAQDFKKSKSTLTDVGKFYSFVKSQTSAELDVATLVDRAWNLIVMEDYNEAINTLRKALAIDSRNIKSLGFMSLALMNKGKYDEAMLFLQKVLVIEPDNPFALNNLGYICYKKGIWGEAIEHLSKAAKQQKDRTAALYANFYLGLVYYERTMIPDAIRFFNAALKVGPNLQEAYYYLGLSEIKRYEFKKAVVYFTQCIEMDSESKYSRMSETEIKKIKPLIEPGKALEEDSDDDSNESTSAE
jgi:tetratricopeptide (TPR) repeat protein